MTSAQNKRDEFFRAVEQFLQELAPASQEAAAAGIPADVSRTKAAQEAVSMENSAAGKDLDAMLWEVLNVCQDQVFQTAKGLQFRYYIKGNEMFVSRKDKSLTRATVQLAFHTALAIQRRGEAVTGPKKLGTFGASYLYPIFIELGIIRKG